jgi:hypothetical protein
LLGGSSASLEEGIAQVVLTIGRVLALIMAVDVRSRWTNATEQTCEWRIVNQLIVLLLNWSSDIILVIIERFLHVLLASSSTSSIVHLLSIIRICCK